MTVIGPQVAGLMTAETVLGLPAGQVGIDQDIAIRDKSGAHPDHQN